jgi:hypothetical protein
MVVSITIIYGCIYHNYLLALSCVLLVTLYLVFYLYTRFKVLGSMSQSFFLYFYTYTRFAYSHSLLLLFVVLIIVIHAS